MGPPGFFLENEPYWSERPESIVMFRNEIQSKHKILHSCVRGRELVELNVVFWLMNDEVGGAIVVTGKSKGHHVGSLSIDRLNFYPQN